MKKTLFLSFLLLSTFITINARRSSELPELRPEYFIHCENGDCIQDNMEQLRSLGFDGYTRADVEIMPNTEYETYTLVFDFKSAKDADAFMKTFDELWKNKNGFKKEDLKSAGLRSEDVCVSRFDNSVWIGYVFMFK